MLHKNFIMKDEKVEKMPINQEYFKKMIDGKPIL